MLAVSAPASAVERYLVQGAEIAAYNGPSQVVVAGPVAPIEALCEILAKDKIKARMLASRRAFHTSSMRPALGEIEAGAKRVALKSPSIAVHSNLTGDLFASAPEPDYFARQACSPVRFGSALSRLIETGHRVFLEIGPGTALSGLIRAHGSDASLLAVPVLPEPESGDAVEQALTAAGRIWAAGFPLDWQKVDLRAKGRIVSLPPYPFARTRCWVGSSPTVPTAGRPREGEAKVAASSDAVSEIAAIWAACLGREQIETNADYHRLGGDSLSAIRIAELLSERFGVLIRPSDFLTAETPRRVAALIEDRRRGKQQATGIVIVPRDSDPHQDLLVLFHAIGGTVHLYGELLSALPEHCSIRLVQAPPFAGAGAQPETIEAMAKAYLAVLDLDGRRRVHFGGASFGGSIALEAARQWLAQGKSAASIIMLDSPAPGDFNARIFDEADVLAFVAQLIGGSVPAGHLRGMSQEARYQRIMELVAEHLPGGVDDEALALHINVLRINALAMNLYRPEPLDDVPVTFLLAALRDMGQPEAPQKSWARFIRGPLWVETVPGGHLSMLTEPNVTKTAQAIERALARFAAQPAGCLS
jgi:phthiocerol/phenolphthiocerol synthesis type-I polyketide synthase E